MEAISCNIENHVEIDRAISVVLMLYFYMQLGTLFEQSENIDKICAMCIHNTKNSLQMSWF